LSAHTTHGEDPRPLRDRKRRIDELVAKRAGGNVSTKIGAGKAGPGRGRKRPIAEYAEGHGV
jgi:hypothetical protein